MKTKFKKILNLTKSLKTKTSMSYITLTSCLTIALFSTLTSKAAATVLPTLFEVPMNNIKERVSAKEIWLFNLFLFLLAVLADIKRLIKKRKLQKEETYQSNQPTEPKETTEEVNSNEIRETDDNESSEQ